MRRGALLLLALAACSPGSKPVVATPTERPKPWISYVCEDGRSFQALYPDASSARLRLGAQQHGLKIAMSGSGARYVGDGLQWWNKGPEGMLATLAPGETIATAPGVNCREPGGDPAPSASRPTG